MSELTVFLEARLAEDEQRGGCGGPDRRCAEMEARVLVEVEAKRAIVALHSPYEFPQVMTYGTIIACNECGSVDDSPQEWPCPTLRLLASVYRDHPGYQEGWAL